MGILIEDDFETPSTMTDNWVKKVDDTHHTGAIIFNADINSNVLTFT